MVENAQSCNCITNVKMRENESVPKMEAGKEAGSGEKILHAYGFGYDLKVVDEAKMTSAFCNCKVIPCFAMSTVDCTPKSIWQAARTDKFQPLCHQHL